MADTSQRFGSSALGILGASAQLVKRSIVAEAEHTAPESPPSPLAQALLSEDLVAVRNILHQEIGANLSDANVMATWERAVHDGRLDIACAIVRLMPDDTLLALSRQTEDFEPVDGDYESLSLLHQAFHLGSENLKELLKRFPHVSRRNDLGTAYNNLGLKFADGLDKKCNALAAYWMWQRMQHEAARALARRETDVSPASVPRFDIEANEFGVDSIEDMPDEFKYGMSRLLAVAPDVDLIDAQDWPQYAKGISERLTLDGEGDDQERYAFYGIATPTHVTVCELKAKNIGEDMPVHVRLLYDANNRYMQTRARTPFPEDLANWSLESLHENQEKFELSFPDDERCLLVFHCRRDMVERLVAGDHAPAAPALERRIRNMPAGTAKFTPQIMYNVLGRHFFGTWLDLQPELHDFARIANPVQLRELLNPVDSLREDVRPVFHWMLRSNLAEAKAYVKAIADLPVADTLKAQILCAEDIDNRSPFATAAARQNMRQTLGELGDTPFVRLMQHHVEEHSTTGRSAALPPLSGS